jgi:hypothetical protein
MPHQHSHGCGHEHDGDGHSHDVPMESGPSDNLYSQVDVEHVVALNAEGGGETGRKVIKWVLGQQTISSNRRQCRAKLSRADKS